jgi:hypothetical protein
MKRFLAVAALLALAGCAPNTIKGTDKAYDVVININNNSGYVHLESPLKVDSTSETTQDANPSTVISPETSAAMPSGGSTASIAAQAATQSLKDVASKLANDLSKKNSENPTTTGTNQAAPVVAKPVVAGTTDTQATDEVPVVAGTEGPTRPILWKPVADSGGKLVILLPSSMGKPDVAVANMDGSIIETGVFAYFSNPDRATYRFGRAGADFPQPCLLIVGDTAYLVKSPAKRAEALPTYTK